MRLKLITVFFVSVLIVSCNQEKHKHLLEIEKMENTLDSLYTIAYDTTQQNAQRITHSVKETILKLKNGYEKDTLNLDLVKKIERYKEIDDVLLINSGNIAKVKQAIPEVQKNLENLKHDIKNGINDRERYIEFINFEQSKINDIKSILNYYFQTLDEFTKRYDSLHPIINHLGDSLILKTYE